VVIAGVKREWSSRLARLTRLVEAAAPGPTWLWRIRIRILSYLLARYGEPVEPGRPELEAGRQDAEDGAFPAPREPAPPVVMETTLPPVAVAHPPRRGDVILPVLEEIHEVNDALWIARWQEPPPDLVWTWWRSAWCRRP
jgi:hypothetical protein